MALTNKEVAQIFENIADILEIQGESKFKFLSYRRASEIIPELPRDLQAYIADKTLLDIPGVGKAIGDKITELLTTGKMEFYEKRKTEIPLGLLDIKRINGVGPKKAKLFWDELNITTIEALKEAAQAGRLAGLPGMGKKSEQKVLEGIEALARRSDRIPIGTALPAAEHILELLMELPEVQEGIIAGSIRRGRPTIGDVDILICSDNAEPIMDTFVHMQNVARILGHGSTKSSVELHNGLQADVRVLARKNWGAALQYFTGSQAHNIAIREITREKGYSLNEEALRPVDDEGNLKPESEYVFCETEAEVYEKIGLPWIPPELRENAGEIEAALAGKLPNLITIRDIQSDLHMHTTYSDGVLSIREMANAARERGMKYIVITDHSQASVQAGGLKPEEVLAQQIEVRNVNTEMGDDFHVLHGIEMDIKADGSLDFDDEVLKQLDFVIASLHISLRQEREQITKRLLNAIKNPHVDMIGHPTARLLSRRESSDVDMNAVIDAAVQYGTALEINANPERLDLDAQYVRLAVQKGALLSINTDAHSASMMDTRHFGILTARRGWAEARHVINTWSYEKFIEWVRSRG